MVKVQWLLCHHCSRLVKLWIRWNLKSRPHTNNRDIERIDNHLHECKCKVDEPILVGRLNRRPTFEPKMVLKETESCLLQNLKSQLWAIGCVEIFSSIWVAY
jgi:hypothetical protein